jgi:hypothetical protein
MEFDQERCDILVADDVNALVRDYVPKRGTRGSMWFEALQHGSPKCLRWLVKHERPEASRVAPELETAICDYFWHQPPSSRRKEVIYFLLDECNVDINAPLRFTDSTDFITPFSCVLHHYMDTAGTTAKRQAAKALIHEFIDRGAEEGGEYVGWIAHYRARRAKVLAAKRASLYAYLHALRQRTRVPRDLYRALTVGLLRSAWKEWER